MNSNLPEFPTAAPPSTLADSSNQIGLRDLMLGLWSGRWLLVSGILAGIGLGLLYCWAATPMYRADALVQVERKSKSVTGTSDDLYELMAGRDSTSTEIELLKSRMVVGRVVDQLRLDLTATPRYFPFIGRSIASEENLAWIGRLARSMPGLSRYAWGGERIHVSALTVPDALLNSPLRLLAGAEGTFSLSHDNGDLMASGKMGEVAAFTTPDGSGSLFVRDLAAEPGTEFELKLSMRLETVQALSKRLRIIERGRLSGILSISLEGADPAIITQVVREIAIAYQRQNVERRSAEAEQTLEFINEQLPRVQGDLEAAESQLNRYRLKQKSADLTKETELVLQQSVQLEQNRLDLQQKREASLRRFTVNHPVIDALDAQLAQLAGEQRSLAERVHILPETQQELLRLSRDIQVNSSLYTALLNNAEQLRIAKAGTIGNIRIVDFPIEPSTPASPVKGFVMTVSLIAGCFFGIVAVLLRNALRSGVTDPAVIERAFGLPAYAVIPFSSAQRRIGRRIERGESIEGILAKSDLANPAMEAVRSLRTVLHVERAPHTNNVLMICGPAPGLGKSFVSVNLAAALAMTGQRVLLVDGDIRRGHLHQFLGLGSQPGLADYLAARCEPSQIVYPTYQDNLFLIPTGTIPPDPSELLLGERFQKLIHSLAGSYDQIIVDSAPVLSVSDAILIGRVAGTVLVVLRSGHHSLRLIDDTLKHLRTGRLAVKGFVFNHVDRARSEYGSRTGYYGYQYQSSK